MTRMVIENVYLDSAQEKRNILIEGNRFASLNAPSDTAADIRIDGTDKAILPPFFNMHTHSAMTLLRGYADDMPLFTWLNDYIWPFEAKMDAEDIRAGTALAALEMIRSGTVFMNDMYWHEGVSQEVAAAMGMRGCFGHALIGFQPKDVQQAHFDEAKKWKDATGRMMHSIAPHAIYTCDAELLKNSSDLARELGIPLHIHLSETAKEVQDCFKEHGMSPVKYLDSLGVLGEKVIAAHVVHVDEDDIRILKERGVVIVSNPVSNMKLASGVFPAGPLLAAGCRIALGTDGASSNNNLDMREEMKISSLLAKVRYGAEVLPAAAALSWATRAGAQAMGIDSGEIREGALADAVLVDLTDPALQPLHHLVSNWVYAAGSNTVDTVICDGRILMQGRHVPGQEQILQEARAATQRVLARVKKDQK